MPRERPRSLVLKGLAARLKTMVDQDVRALVPEGLRNKEAGRVGQRNHDKRSSLGVEVAGRKGVGVVFSLFTR